MPVTAVGTPQFDPPNSSGIVARVSEHTTLRTFSDTLLQGVCPFCGSAAFRVRPEPLGTFHCLRCGEGGNSTMFLAKIGQGADCPTP
jgi:DNA primase